MTSASLLKMFPVHPLSPSFSQSLLVTYPVLWVVPNSKFTSPFLFSLPMPLLLLSVTAVTWTITMAQLPVFLSLAQWFS